MANLLSWFRRPIERKSAATLDLWRALHGGGQPALSGQVVTWNTALQVSTVRRCVQVIADGVSTIPLKVYQKGADGDRTEDGGHPLSDVLGVRANPWQTGQQYRETIAYHVALCGNHYSFINRTSRGVAELIPLEPGCVSVAREPTGYGLKYNVTANGKTQDFPAESIWHVRGPSWNGWFGLEPVRLSREAIGLALATEEHHAKLHANGARPGGLYSVEGTLDADGYKALRAWLTENVEGSDNAYKTLILDRAAKFQQISMTGVDSQHLETRRMQVEEICRSFGVLPIMVGHSDKTATYASAEQMFLAHVVHTIRPWHRRLEADIEMNLLTPLERKRGLYVKFVDTELLRGAANDRAAYYSKALGSGGSYGWMTPNDVREAEDMERIEGGDKLPSPPAPSAPAAALGATK